MFSRITCVRRGTVKLAAMVSLAAILIAVVSPGVAQGQGGAPAQAQPEAVCPAGGQCFADVPSGHTFYTNINRIYQQDLVGGYACGGLGEPCDAYNRPYYRPDNVVNRGQMAKFLDNARRMPEIHMEVGSGSAPIWSRNTTGTAISAFSTSGQAFTAVSQSASAIYAQTGNTNAIYGFSTGGHSGAGVYGTGYVGVKGVGNSNYGVSAISTGGAFYAGTAGANATAVYAISDDEGAALAGQFIGNVNIIGTCCEAAQGTFKIDHPLDPTNKYLYHAAVQSQEMTNIYNGNVTLDDKGEALVRMPDWFEALNTEFRYQLTAIGAPGPNLYIAEEIQDNRFRIAGGQAGMKVSWMVTGIRHDAYASAHPIAIEQEKPEAERGKYLYPKEVGQPESLGVNYEAYEQLRQDISDSIR